MRIDLQEVGPIQQAHIEPGDLTVLVGPQATGKSIFLALFKLLLDFSAIQKVLRQYDILWGDDADTFFSVYFGEGMEHVWSAESVVKQNGNVVNRADIAKWKRAGSVSEQVFYIPAQRVLALRDGLTHPFTDFRAGDPFVVRQFSDILHRLVQSEFARHKQLFPQRGRLKGEFRDMLDAHIFGGYHLQSDMDWVQRRLVLAHQEQKLPFMVWSAGQREFVPLLLGLYWLLPAGHVSRRKGLQWVVIEEPEMGLHPYAIQAVLVLLLDLLRRGYRVMVSTHSPAVLDIVWALQVFQEVARQDSQDSAAIAAQAVLRLGDLPDHQSYRQFAEAVLKKTYRVYFFQRSGIVRDISSLDPGDEDRAVWGWGGLSEFSGRVADLVGETLKQAGVAL